MRSYSLPWSPQCCSPARTADAWPSVWTPWPPSCASPRSPPAHGPSLEPRTSGKFYIFSQNKLSSQYIPISEKNATSRYYAFSG